MVETVLEGSLNECQIVVKEDDRELKGGGERMDLRFAADEVGKHLRLTPSHTRTWVNTKERMKGRTCFPHVSK